MKLSEYSNSELLQMYANADITCSQCGGKYKGDRNEELRRKYANELKSRNVIVPVDIHDKVDESFEANVEIPQGVFNGVGSY